jgi:hypothetical protein
MTIPMCWKCANRIEGPFLNIGTKLIGCKACEDIIDYNTAIIYCPLIKEEESS